MAKGVARIGDTVTGVCDGPGHLPHRGFTGHWITSDSLVTANGIAVIRVGDKGVTDCGHHFTAVAGSGLCSAEGKALHRVGDAVIVDEGGSGTTVSGSVSVVCD